MAIDRMKKVAIFGLAEEFPSISHSLQRLSMLHISNIETIENVERCDGGEGLTNAENRLNKVSAALDALKPYDKSKHGMLSAKPQMTESDLMAQDNEQNWDIVEQTLRQSQQMPTLRARHIQIQNAIESLLPYQSLTVRIADIRKSRFVYMALGSMPAAKYETLCDEADKIDAIVEPVDQMRDIKTVFFAVNIAQTAAAEDLLRNVEFTQANFSFEGTVSDERKRLEQESLELDTRVEEIEKILTDLSKHAGDLQTLYDCCSILKQRAALALESVRTKKAFYLSGWVRERRAGDLQEKLSALSDTIVVEISDPAEGEIPPTAMSNGKLLRPFEAVTNMYSAPSPYEADPTFIMAPFFLCFFGMMVSDAAYGIILTVVALLALKLMKPTGMMGQILAVVAMGGVATLIWGALLGGWFGEKLLPTLWFSPLDEPIKMLIVCLGLGLLHITAGILMKGKALIKEHKYIDVVFDCGFILCVLWGAVATFAGLSFGMTVVLVGIIGIFLTAGRSRKGIIRKFIGGFSAVYGLSGYLSDVLSYSRLFGMGLATGIIAMVFNTIAGMLMGSPIGFLFAVVVLVVGHTFNISVNALGAYVHSSRLQYIEFYNKFYEGGGRAFVPYTYKTKYIQLVRN